MSFGDGDLHIEVEKLKDVNGKLCAEVNRLQALVADLEQLVRDWADAPCGVCDPWDEGFACEHFDGGDCLLSIRMTEIGIEVDR